MHRETRRSVYTLLLRLESLQHSMDIFSYPYFNTFDNQQNNCQNSETNGTKGENS